MPTGLTEDKGFIGSGDLMVKNITAGDGGFRPGGNASVFQLTPKIEEVKRISFQRGTRGQTLETNKRMDGVEVRIELDTFGRENLTLALAGTVANFTQSEVTAQSVTVDLPHDQWVETGYHNISSVTITDKVEDTDFIVKPEAGMVMALSTGSITDGAETSMTLNAAAVAAGAGYDIDGGDTPEITLQLRLDGLDESSGKSVITDVWRVKVSPQEAVSFLTSEFNKLVLSGEAETPEGYDSPFRTRVIPAMS